MVPEVPTYRRRVVTNGVSDRLVAPIAQIVPEHGGEVIELVVRPGHVHLFAHFPPTPAPQQIMAGIKGRASHALRREVPALRQRLPSLWTSSYYVATVGNVSSKTVRTYLAVQRGVQAMKKAYLYRLYPTEEQAQALQQQLDVAREVYNACLLERREAYRMAGVTLNYYAQANQLTAIRRDRADIAAVNFSMLQAICRRAQRAYDNFFRRI